MDTDTVYTVRPNNSDASAVQYEEKAGSRDEARTNEAKDIYGDVQTAEEYGYVSRGYVCTSAKSALR